MIEMILLRNEWLAVLKITFICLVILIVYKLIHYIKNGVSKRTTFQSSLVPALKGNHLLIYISFLFSAYKQSTPSCPALALAIQLLWALCLLYGKNGVFRAAILFKQAVVFYKAETVEAVLSDAELIEKGSEYQLLTPWLGIGLITSGGEKWRKHRKMLTPAFHFSILGNFISVFQQQSEILASKLQLRAQEPWIDALPMLSACTLDALCLSTMGISINAQKDENIEYCKAIDELGDSFFYRGLRPWLYPDIIFNFTSLGKKLKKNVKIVHGLSEKVIKEKKIEMLASASWKSKSDNEMQGNYFQNKKPLLELLLEYHLKDPTFTEKDIREEVDTFMFAGHDTTATTLNFVLYCLGLHQEIQEKVHEELVKIFEKEKNDNISRETLAKMKYLECVIKETMRIYPTVPGILRENKKPFKVLGHDVLPGTLCVIFIYPLHRDPESFPDPEKFDPDRFSPENIKERHPYAYVPFSAGSRNCIGQKFAMMEMKIILSTILRHFRIISLDSREKVILYPNIVFRSVKPLRLKFESR